MEGKPKYEFPGALILSVASSSLLRNTIMQHERVPWLGGIWMNCWHRVTASPLGAILICLVIQGLVSMRVMGLRRNRTHNSDSFQ